MRVMVFVKATTDSEAGTLPSPELLEAMGKFNAELVAAGVMVTGEGLKPSSVGRRVAFDGPDRTVLPGPSGAVGDRVAGFWLWQVKDLDEAVAWAKRCPNPCPARASWRSARSTRWRTSRSDPGASATPAPGSPPPTSA